MNRGALVGQQRLARPGEDNYGFIDRYTAGHAAFGVLGGLARLPWWGMLASGLVWDLVIERQFKDLWPEDLAELDAGHLAEHHGRYDRDDARLEGGEPLAERQDADEHDDPGEEMNARGLTDRHSTAWVGESSTCSTATRRRPMDRGAMRRSITRRIGGCRGSRASRSSARGGQYGSSPRVGELTTMQAMLMTLLRSAPRFERINQSMHAFDVDISNAAHAVAQAHGYPTLELTPESEANAQKQAIADY